MFTYPKSSNLISINWSSSLNNLITFNLSSPKLPCKPMSSSQHPPSKFSKKPKISVRPIWRKKMSTCHPSNEFDTPTPMPKPPSPCNEPSKENSHGAQSNQASPQPYSPINQASPQTYSPINLASSPLSDPCVTRVS
ncbi:hypothetical protein Tco_1092689 [Tanacetum coccineum]|uniref:Uncharacterized protein n=1 Tax=Tanacetum coccineum TaxID=301880 RepID=A0ABQ5IAJ9_9ASTR